jgi:hypothetical protein
MSKVRLLALLSSDKHCSLFSSSLMPRTNKLERLSLASLQSTEIIFASKAGAYPTGVLDGISLREGSKQCSQILD